MPIPRRTIAAVVLAAVCLAGGLAFWRSRDAAAFFATPALLGRFPAEDGGVLRVDFEALRRGGFLGEPKAAAEPEYREFLEGTGFNYRRDLDLLVASLSASGTFFIARGRFDWPRVQAYAVKHGGSCFENLCRAQGSVPERKISVVRLRSDAIGLAVGTDELAATRLARAGTPVGGAIPDGPAWVSLPGIWLRRGGFVPDRLKIALSGLVNADRIVVRLLAGTDGVLAQMDATCRNSGEADVLASQLRTAAAALLGSASEDGIGRALAGGEFSVVGSVVTGKWAVGRDFLDTLTAGL